MLTIYIYIFSPDIFILTDKVLHRHILLKNIAYNTHTHTHAHARTHARTHTYIYTNTHTHTHTHTYTHTHTAPVEEVVAGTEIPGGGGRRWEYT